MQVAPEPYSEGPKIAAVPAASPNIVINTFTDGQGSRTGKAMAPVVPASRCSVQTTLSIFLLPFGDTQHTIRCWPRESLSLPAVGALHFVRQLPISMTPQVLSLSGKSQGCKYHTWHIQLHLHDDVDICSSQSCQSVCKIIIIFFEPKLPSQSSDDLPNFGETI